MIAFTSDQWVILALVFFLGLLVGAFLFTGSGRKWKHRYRAEEQRREELEARHMTREDEWAAREKEWREQDSLRGAAIKDRRDAETDRPL
jgi:C4-dicarboxylate-specific signal transduction histidine kinase